MTTAPSSTKRAAAAFVLTLVAPPAGYAFAGRMRAAVIAAASILLLGLALFGFTLVHPPGLYALLRGRHGDTAWIASAIIGWSVAIALGAHASWLARKRVPNQPWPLRLVIGAALTGGVLLGAGIGNRIAPVAVYDVASTSMSPSLMKGEVVAVDGPKALCGGTLPVRGEAVVFREPDGRGLWLKRVIAVPGDVVSTQGGLASVNGKTLSSSAPVEMIHIKRRFGKAWMTQESSGSRAWAVTIGDGGPPDVGPTRLGRAQIFVLGDDRTDSIDSRNFGPVPMSRVCGRLMQILWSPDHARVGARL